MWRGRGLLSQSAILVSTIKTSGAEFQKICNDPQFQQNCNNFVNNGANFIKFSPQNVKTYI